MSVRFNFLSLGTKAFTCQVYTLSLLAESLLKKRKLQEKHQFFLEPNEVLAQSEIPEGTASLSWVSLKWVIDNCPRQIVEVVKLLCNTEHCFILGKGVQAHAIALEAALKIKEITYIHAEGFCGGALKHGPFALIDTKTVIFIMIFDDMYVAHFGAF